MPAYWQPLTCKRNLRAFGCIVPSRNLPPKSSLKSTCRQPSDGWPEFSNIFRNKGQSLPQPWAELFGPLREGAVDDIVVVGQIGQSLDGRIATESGHSKYINGPAGLAHLHRLRALVDAVIIGVGTAIADDPQLTVRLVACLLYTSPSPRDSTSSRMPSSA